MRPKWGGVAQIIATAIQAEPPSMSARGRDGRHDLDRRLSVVHLFHGSLEIDGGSLADIFIARSETRWLRL
jgi:hypothetical protein